MQVTFISKRALGACQGRSCEYRLPVPCRPTRLVVVAAKKGDKKGGDKKGPKKSALVSIGTALLCAGCVSWDICGCQRGGMP